MSPIYIQATLSNTRAISEAVYQRVHDIKIEL